MAIHTYHRYHLIKWTIGSAVPSIEKFSDINQAMFQARFAWKHHVALMYKAVILVDTVTSNIIYGKPNPQENPSTSDHYDDSGWPPPKGKKTRIFEIGPMVGGGWAGSKHEGPHLLKIVRVWHGPDAQQKAEEWLTANDYTLRRKLRRRKRAKKPKDNPGGLTRLGKLVQLRYERDQGKKPGFYKHDFTSDVDVYYNPRTNSIIARPK